jgi:fermentation-respiration switch protein FrsA (DUF1100 family)
MAAAIGRSFSITTCAAWYYPGTNGGCVIMAGGLAVTKEPGMDLFAKRFNDAGFAVLAFDCRHLGESDGQPRQIARIGEQHADWQAAIAFARTLPGVDPRRLAMWGFPRRAAASSRCSPSAAATRRSRLRRSTRGECTRSSGSPLEAADGFDAVALAPVSPLWLNTVLGGIDKNNALATARGTEVLADPTTALSLEAALRRRDGERVVRACSVDRVLRLQPFPGSSRRTLACSRSLSPAGRGSGTRSSSRRCASTSRSTCACSPRSTSAATGREPRRWRSVDARIGWTS